MNPIPKKLITNLADAICFYFMDNEGIYQFYNDYNNTWINEIGPCILEHTDFLCGRHHRTVMAKYMLNDILNQLVNFGKFYKNNMLI